MTAANNGASTPEDDDPFGYLYEDGRAAGATPPGQSRGYGYPGPAAQPGVPRTSYNQVRTVGERQYGQQVPQQQAYGQQHGQPTAQYAAPETYPGGAPTRPVPPPGNGDGHGGGRSGGPNTKGLLIGAIAVVAVVVIGIAAALMSNGGEKDKAGDQPGGTGGTKGGQSVKPKPEPSASDDPAELPQQDAATLQLGAPAALAKDIKGAKGAGGAYVSFNGVGGSASWSVKVPEGGEYTLFITYGVPGKDAKTSLTINGGTPRSINMSNFAKAAEGDWEKGWTRTYAYVNLEKGKNDLKISCEQGDQCEAYLDQVSLAKGHAKS
ncbi:carbohydrate-binding protein [Streptomyces sp. NBC_00829]|uniref:carbohydrate-binding protein n=1 Tax=Streptomyces sp. NBC_00829 TaxID=2903679 RepID=UPI0038658C33|nr:carbohydrate-binding protein [Streptomyces sp. NBC_00829]